MRRVGLVVLVALAVGATLWLAWDPATKPAEVSPEAAPNPAAASGVLSADPDRTDPDTSTARNRVTTGDAQGSHVAVQIVERASGRPMPQARVWFLADADKQGFTAEQLRQMRQLSNDREAVVVQFGRSIRPDSDAIVRIPGPGDRLEVVARHEDLFGVYMYTPRAAPPHRLELLRDVALAVRAVDQAGVAQQGIPVSLLLRIEGSLDFRQRRLGKTDAEGRLLVSHFPHLLESLARIYGAFAEVSVAPDLPGLHDQARAVDPEHLPNREIRLEIPATGRITIRLLGEFGHRLAKRAHISLQFDLDPANDSSLHYQASMSAAAAGEMVFPRVGLQRTFQLLAQVDAATVRQQVQGPRLPGEEVEVAVSLATDYPLLQGTIRDPSGAPAAAEHFAYSIAAQGLTSSGSVVARQNGDITIALPADFTGTSPTGVALEKLDRGRPSGLRADLPIGFELRPGDNALGSATLANTPLVVSGIVVDEDGVPLDAQLWIERRVADDLGGAAWQVDRSLTARLLGDGAFAVHGTPSAGDLRLQARHAECVAPPPTEFASGAAGLRVVLTRAGWVTLVALVDPGISLERIAWKLTPSGPSTTAQERQLEWSGPGSGQCVWDQLLPGTHDLTGRTIGNPTPFEVIEHIEVRGSRAADDARLLPLDLRGVLHPVALTFTTPSGARLATPGGGVYQVHSRADTAEGVPIVQGQARLVLTEPARLRIRVPGYRDEELFGVLADRAVQLRPALRARIRVTAPELPTGMHLEVALENLEEEAPPRTYLRLDHGVGQPKTRTSPSPVVQAERTADGTFSTAVGSAGRYRVRVDLHAETAGKIEVVSLSAAIVTLREAAGEQSFSVEVSQAQLDAALASWK